jgi:hypothetical protein
MDSYNKVNQPKQAVMKKNLCGNDHIELFSYLEKHGIPIDDVIVHNKAFVDQGALYEKQYTRVNRKTETHKQFY